MNDLDLSRPATRQRTSNVFRPGPRRIAKTRTSNEFTVILPPEMTGNLTIPAPPQEERPGSLRRCRNPGHDLPRQLVPGHKRPSDRGPAPAPGSQPGPVHRTATRW